MGNNKTPLPLEIVLKTDFVYLEDLIDYINYLVAVKEDYEYLKGKIGALHTMLYNLY